MGVSLGWFDPDTVSDNDYIFYQVYGAQQSGDNSQNLFPLQVDGLDLTAQGRFVRAFTVPQNSWEPLFNLTPPVEAGDPRPWSTSIQNDGGPTRFFNDNPNMCRLRRCRKWTSCWIISTMAIPMASAVRCLPCPLV